MQKAEKINIKWFYIITVAFLLLNLFFIAKENYLFNLVPIAFLIILFAVFAMDRLMLLVVFLTPLSVPLREFIPRIPYDMALPTEPLIFGLMLLFFFKLLTENKLDRKIALHPVSVMIYVNLVWLLITSFTSSLPFVSIKYFLSRIWFVVVFYFLATQLFRNYKNMDRYVWAYMIPMLAVIAFTLSKLSAYGFFNQKAAHSMMNPIFNDHTSYAAVLAMFFPLLVGYIFSSAYKSWKKIAAISMLGIFIIAMIFSYTRASWVSLLVALVFWILLKAKVKLKYIFVSVFILVGLFFVFKTEILMKLEKNRQDSSTNLKEHVQSISNVTSDASNVERLNRWSCAFRMFLEKPFFGWGPGTYQFQYAPFQLSYEKTIISTNAGDRGNAHSEYIGPLAESGVLGTITFLTILIYTLYTGVKVYRRADNKRTRMMAMMLVLGLTTYYVHGFLNNFLDTDKASALFWGFTAMIVALDVYHSKTEQNIIKETNVL